MKMLSAKTKISGLTLVEVLVVLAVLAVLVAILLPAYTGGGPRRQIACMSNQRQIALGFVMFNLDNNGNFPWQLSQTNNGTFEKISDARAFEQFPLAYCSNLRVLVCPIDKVKIITTNTATFSNSNLSYFVNVDAATNNAANIILTGDRYLLANGQTVDVGLFNYSTNEAMSCSKESHKFGSEFGGIFSFADGHAEGVRSTNLDSFFLREGMATDRLIVP